MFAVTTGAVPGSSVKCGLPAGWTSPSERSTCPVRTFEDRKPRTASTTLGEPRSRRGLPLLSMTGSIHASSSSPLRTRISARLTRSIWLGRISRSCGFWPGRVATWTSPRSPTSARVIDQRSGSVASTRSRSCAGGGGGWDDAQDDERAGQQHASEDRGRSARAHQKRSAGCAPRMKVPCRSTSLTERSTEPVPSVCLYCTRKRRNSDGLNCT